MMMVKETSWMRFRMIRQLWYEGSGCKVSEYFRRARSHHEERYMFLHKGLQDTYHVRFRDVLAWSRFSPFASW
jgi:hypothetical protein